MNEKVYCNECKFFGDLPIYYLGNPYCCNAPQNLCRRDDWQGAKYRNKEPRDLNRDNNCGWFEPQ